MSVDFHMALLISTVRDLHLFLSDTCRRITRGRFVLTLQESSSSVVDGEVFDDRSGSVFLLRLVRNTHTS